MIHLPVIEAAVGLAEHMIGTVANTDDMRALKRLHSRLGDAIKAAEAKQASTRRGNGSKILGLRPRHEGQTR